MNRFLVILIVLSSTSFGRMLITPKGSTPAAFSNAKSVLFRTSAGQGIDFGTNSAISPNFNFPFTLSFWMKATDLTQNFTTIIGKIQPAPYVGFEAQLKSQTLDFTIGASGSNYLEVQTGNVFTSNSTWYHVAIVVSGSGLASGVTVYINATSKTLTTNHDNLGGGTITNTTAFSIGARSAGSNTITGNLDEVAYFNTNLSSGNVTSLFNSGHPGDVSLLSFFSNCQLWSRMGDGDTTGANNILDHSANAFTGTGNNFFTSDFVTDVP